MTQCKKYDCIMEKHKNQETGNGSSVTVGFIRYSTKHLSLALCLNISTACSISSSFMQFSLVLYRGNQHRRTAVIKIKILRVKHGGFYESGANFLPFFCHCRAKSLPLSVFKAGANVINKCRRVAGGSPLLT